MLWGFSWSAPCLATKMQFARRTPFVKSKSDFCGIAKMGIVDHQNSELADLEMETKPEDVLAEIARLHQRALSEKKPTAMHEWGHTSNA